MGLLAPDKRFILDYRGRGCGGCNLPFDEWPSALRYAEQMGALSATVTETGTGNVRRFERKQRRGSLREVAR